MSSGMSSGMSSEIGSRKASGKSGSIGGSIGGSINLSAKQKEILSIIQQNSKISYRSIAEILKINNSAVRKHLDKLKKYGVIKRIGGTRGHWKITHNESEN
jgi:ATP-dependent DNA helicase RecG